MEKKEFNNFKKYRFGLSETRVYITRDKISLDHCSMFSYKTNIKIKINMQNISMYGIYSDNKFVDFSSTMQNSCE